MYSTTKNRLVRELTRVSLRVFSRFCYFTNYLEISFYYLQLDT